MSRMKKLKVVDAVLSNLALGYKNPNLINEQLMPIVPVNGESVKVPVFGATAYRIHETSRAIRGATNVMSPDAFEMIDITLKEHDLGYPIDYREKDESYFSLTSMGTFHATLGVQLKREKAVADLAQDPNNYANSNKIALSGSSQFTDQTSDVLGIFDDAKQAIEDGTAADANTLVLDSVTYRALRRHKQLLDKLRVKDGMIRHQDLAEILEIEKIIVGKSIYSDANKQRHKFWNNSAILAYVPEAQANVDRNKYEPSFGYTLRKKKTPFVDKYMTEGNKVEVIRSTEIYKSVMTMPDAGYLISNTVA